MTCQLLFSIRSAECFKTFNTSRHYAARSERCYSSLSSLLCLPMSLLLLLTSSGKNASFNARPAKQSRADCITEGLHRLCSWVDLEITHLCALICAAGLDQCSSIWITCSFQSVVRSDTARDKKVYAFRPSWREPLKAAAQSWVSCKDWRLYCRHAALARRTPEYRAAQSVCISCL